MTAQAPQSPSVEQRKEKRYKVDLWGELRFEDGELPVRIKDLSASGALLYLDTPPPRGCVVCLWISDFGEVEVRVMHASDTFCGVAFTHPAQHRAALLDWLRQEVAVDVEAGAATPPPTR